MIQLQVITVVMMVCASGIRKDERKKGRRRIHSFEREKAVVVAIEVPWCGHTCILHEEVLNPSLWRKLLLHPLEMVFTQLPMEEIAQLWCISKFWNSMFCVLLIFQVGMLSVRFLQRCLG